MLVSSFPQTVTPDTAFFLAALAAFGCPFDELTLGDMHAVLQHAQELKRHAEELGKINLELP
jgi:hypothetical protein